MSTPRRSLLKGIATVALAPFACAMPVWGIAAAAGGGRPDEADARFWTDPRSVAVVNENTGKSGQFLYWADGAFMMDGYMELSKLLYDHHENKAVQMQPGVFDLMYATQRWYLGATGKGSRHLITSGYRTPHTNAMVGGAPGGMHPEAAALDGRLEGVPLGVYARMLMAFGMGGVGLYSRHVHWDVGRSPRVWSSAGRES